MSEFWAFQLSFLTFKPCNYGLQERLMSKKVALEKKCSGHRKIVKPETIPSFLLGSLGTTKTGSGLSVFSNIHKWGPPGTPTYGCSKKLIGRSLFFGCLVSQVKRWDGFWLHDFPTSGTSLFPTTLRCVGSRFECIPSRPPPSSFLLLLSPPPIHITHPYT